MVAALLAGFDLPQLYPGIVSSGAEPVSYTHLTLPTKLEV